MPNRELKFRAWDTTNKCWVVMNSGHYQLYPDGNILSLNKLTGLIFTQFTGKFDDNKNEIYEGDIMDVGYSGGHERDSSYDWHGNFEVKFDDGGWIISNKEGNHFLYMPEYIKPGIYSFKVIGNIFENKKLMEDE